MFVTRKALEAAANSPGALKIIEIAKQEKEAAQAAAEFFDFLGGK